MIGDDGENVEMEALAIISTASAITRARNMIMRKWNNPGAITHRSPPGLSQVEGRALINHRLQIELDPLPSPLTATMKVELRPGCARVELFHKI